MPTEPERLRQYQALLAPGTPLRDGLERIIRGRTGALIVLGRNRQLELVSTGGFALDVPFTPQSLRELAKMDGAIVLDASATRIVSAGVHLQPDASVPTPETGTRHRTADRLARQTGVPAITVSASMSTVTLFLACGRHLVSDSETLLSKANQALQALERYQGRLTGLTNRLSALEVEDQVTLRDLSLVMQRIEMIRRLESELGGYVVELGTDGRLLDLQLRELTPGTDDLAALIELDYDLTPGTGGFADLAEMTATDLLDPLLVARTIGFSSNEQLDSRVAAKGLRQLSQINRLPSLLAPRLLEHFGSLQSLFAASTIDLQLVEGVGEGRAKIIRDGLTRLAESAFTERLG